jgi:hypothetical protein
MLALIRSLAIPLGIIMLVVWTIGAFAFEGPGWIHLLLTLGVFFVIWGIVAKGTPEADREPAKAAAKQKR